MLSWLFSDPLPTGTLAPDFTLTDQDGQAVTLSALRGKNVVLVFYPGDETATCRQQLSEFRDCWAQAVERNALVFGINPGSAKSHKKFRERRAFPFPLLVDQGQSVAKLYEASGLIVKRTVYLIGPDGKILYSRRGKPLANEVIALSV